MRTSRNACENVCHPGIDLSGICLPRYGIAFFKSHLCGNHGINLVYRLLVLVKQLQEACLCPRRSLRSQQLEASRNVLQILQIHQKFLHPERCAFSDCRRLGRLEVCKRKCRKVLVLVRKLCQLVNDIDQLFVHELERLVHHDDVCVVPDIARSRPKMDDARCLWTLLPISIHMAHDIMAHKLLALPCHLIIDILGMCLQFVNLLL